jgi:hypothetical protein
MIRDATEDLFLGPAAIITAGSYWSASAVDSRVVDMTTSRRTQLPVSADDVEKATG